MTQLPVVYDFFFFNDTATTEIYTLSLHDALPICGRVRQPEDADLPGGVPAPVPDRRRGPGCATLAARRHLRGNRCRGDRKSTRLNSSHSQISYAVFCLKKKTQSHTTHFTIDSYYC